MNHGTQAHEVEQGRDAYGREGFDEDEEQGATKETGGQGGRGRRGRPEEPLDRQAGCLAAQATAQADQVSEVI